MKILEINKYFYEKGGAERVFFDEARLLASKGHAVIPFSMQHPQNTASKYGGYFVPHIDYDRSGGLSGIRAASGLLYSRAAKRNIERLLLAEKPDIAHLHNIYHQISPSILHSLKKHGIPVVMTLHDYKLVCASYSMTAGGRICEACRNGRYYNCYLNKCVKDSGVKSLLNTAEMYLHHKLMHIYDLVDVFISPSRFLAAKFREMGFKRDIEYLPNFVDPGNLAPAYGYKERSVVYFGRISKEKGLLTLVKAMRKLPDLTLKIIGDGPLQMRVEAEIVSLGLKNIRLLGYMDGDALREEILKTMFIVLPSEWYENNPKTCIEGFAMGKPAVGANVGGIPELIKDGKTGLLFKMGDSEDLAAKINYLAGRPDLIGEMGRNARAFVENDLNAGKHYEGLMRIYQKAIAKVI